MPGVVCPVPGGAFYVLAHLPVDDAEKFGQWLLEDFSLDNQTLMLSRRPTASIRRRAWAGRKCAWPTSSTRPIWRRRSTAWRTRCWCIPAAPNPCPAAAVEAAIALTV